MILVGLRWRWVLRGWVAKLDKAWAYEARDCGFSSPTSVSSFSFSCSLIPRPVLFRHPNSARALRPFRVEFSAASKIRPTLILRI